MARDSGLRDGGCTAFVLATVSVLCAVASVAACITAPPPDLPVLPDQRPSIEHTAVFPREGVLTQWPDGGEFTIPVSMAKPGELFSYEVIYDHGTSSQVDQIGITQAPVIPDGGTEILPITLKPPADTSVCPHQIEFLVAARFASDGTFDAIGGDVAQWTYFANGTPTGCPPYEAGTGAFPEGGDQ